MFTWLVILCCHLVCGAMQVLCRQKETYERKSLGHRMMHGKGIWKPGIGQIAKAFWTPAAKVIVLTYIGLLPMTIKLNPSMKKGGQQKCLDKTLLLWCSNIFDKVFWMFMKEISFIKVYIIFCIFCPFMLLKVRYLYNCPYFLLL